MLVADVALVIIFSIGLAAVLFKKEDAIEKWASAKHGRRINW